MLPPPILSEAPASSAPACTAPNHCVCPRHIDEHAAGLWAPQARPCIPPSADDRMALLRALVLHDLHGYKTTSAHVLASRAALGDGEAWDAVAGDMEGPGRGHASDVARALGRGDLDAATQEAALVCGALDDEGRPDSAKWLRESREEAARKGGAR